VSWYRLDHQTGILLIEVHVQPGARSESVSLFSADALKVRIMAKAVDGAANAALTACLAKRLHVAKSHVTIRRGETSRRKTVEIRVAVFEPSNLLDPVGDCLTASD